MDDYWIGSPLNKAHFYERKAKGCSKKLLYDEAINCHSCALSELQKALEYTNNSKALQSIQLQIQHHERQKDYFKWKKLQYQAYVKAVKLQKEAMSKIMKASSSKENESGKDDKKTTLGTTFYRITVESDTILDFLAQSHKENQDDENQSNEFEPSCTERSNALNKMGELQVLNSTLRSLITELIHEMMSKEKEMKEIEEKFAKLKAETTVENTKSANIFTDSQHFTISSVDEMVKTSTANLPNLPPLELPCFDYKMFHSEENEANV